MREVNLKAQETGFFCGLRKNRRKSQHIVPKNDIANLVGNYQKHTVILQKMPWNPQAFSTKNIRKIIRNQ